MRKIIFIGLAVMLSFVSCSNDGIVETDQEIPNEYAGLELGGPFYEYNAWQALEGYTGLEINFEKRKFGKGKKVIFYTHDINEYIEFGGYTWEYVQTYVTEYDQLAALEFTDNAVEYKTLESVYSGLKDALGKKYGRAKELISDKQRVCRWRHELNMVILCLEESASENGEMLAFLTITYLNTDLYNMLVDSAESEL